MLWNPNEVEVKIVRTDGQFIHAEVYTPNMQISYTVTVIYAFNNLEDRIKLWKELEQIGSLMVHPWIVMGDFNNVINTNDRIGGNKVTEKEFRDLVEMMQVVGLFEADTMGAHFTWTNKQTTCTIYSRIDRLVGNAAWFHKFHEAQVYVMNPHISDHSPIKVDLLKVQNKRTNIFKFLNSIIPKPSYL